MPRMWGLDPDQYRNMPVITDIARKVIATQMVTRSQPGVALRCGASPDSVGSVMWSIVLELPHTALSARQRFDVCLAPNRGTESDLVIRTYPEDETQHARFTGSDRIDEFLPNLSVVPRKEHRCQATPRSQ